MEKPEELNAEVIELSNKALGPEHSDVFATMNHQMCLYRPAEFTS
jgi:hypothetical protein